MTTVGNQHFYSPVFGLIAGKDVDKKNEPDVGREMKRTCCGFSENWVECDLHLNRKYSFHRPLKEGTKMSK